MENIKHIYSINFDKEARSPNNIIYLIFHYTGMISEKKAIKKLSHKKSKSKLSLFYKKKWRNY